MIPTGTVISNFQSFVRPVPVPYTVKCLSKKIKLDCTGTGSLRTRKGRYRGTSVADPDPHGSASLGETDPNQHGNEEPDQSLNRYGTGTVRYNIPEECLPGSCGCLQKSQGSTWSHVGPVGQCCRFTSL